MTLFHAFLLGTVVGPLLAGLGLVLVWKLLVVPAAKKIAGVP